MTAEEGWARLGAIFAVRAARDAGVIRWAGSGRILIHASAHDDVRDAVTHHRDVVPYALGADMWCPVCNAPPYAPCSAADEPSSDGWHAERLGYCDQCTDDSDEPQGG